METTGTSVAEALGRAHVSLLADLGKLENAAHAEAKVTINELRALLEATKAHVADHFRFEEQNGYMELLRKSEPRLNRAIDHLAEEHRDLLRSLETLVDKARVASSTEEPLRGPIHEWIGRIRQHEARENDLVQDTFSLDIGAKD